MSSIDIDYFPTSTTAKRMLSRVSPIYSNAYVAKWLYQVMGIEIDEAWKIVKELRDQAFTSTVTWGITYQEYKYSINPDNTLTLDERRARLHRKKTTKYPMNPGRIEKYMEDDWGIKCEIDETYAAGVFLIAILQDDDNNLRSMLKDLKEMKPSHLSWKLLYRIINELIEYESVDMSDGFDVYAAMRFADYYPWPANMLDGSWRFCDVSRFDATWNMDGKRHIDGHITVPPGHRFDASVEGFDVLTLDMPRGIHDDMPRAAMEFNGQWKIDGAYRFGADQIPLDIGGQIQVRQAHRFDGRWRFDGGDANYMDGSIYLDGRMDFSGGGIRFGSVGWSDKISGVKSMVSIKKIIPESLRHPKLDDNESMFDSIQVMQIHPGINIDDSMSRMLRMEEMRFDGGTIFGDNVTPIDCSGGLIITHAKRMNGKWRFDGGDVIRLDGGHMLDGSFTFAERGNRYAIKSISEPF
jgi:hypothetical protein